MPTGVAMLGLHISLPTISAVFALASAFSFPFTPLSCLTYISWLSLDTVDILLPPPWLYLSNSASVKPGYLCTVKAACIA